MVDFCKIYKRSLKRYLFFEKKNSCICKMDLVEALIIEILTIKSLKLLKYKVFIIKHEAFRI